MFGKMIREPGSESNIKAKLYLIVAPKISDIIVDAIAN